VEPRVNYPRLLSSRSPVPWKGRNEDPADEGVWAVTCFVTRKGFRNRGVSAALVAAVPDFARNRGARAVEGYPMLTQPGKEITWGELFVGSVNSFADAGFVEVSAPTPRRRVMRIDF
jgi:GNAT superfamily N-acetyltransferase